MGIRIDLEKVNYKDFLNKLMENKKINNRELLEKIILEFGNHIGDDLVILHNEYYEDGICTWNMCQMIREVFNLTYDEDPYDIYREMREDLIRYKEINDAYDNLKLERNIENDR